MSLLGINPGIVPQVSSGGGLLGAMTPGLSQNPYSPMYGTNPYTQQAMGLAHNGYTHGPFAAVTPPPAVATPTASSPSTLSQLLPLLGVAGLAAGSNGLLGTAIQGGLKSGGNYLSSLLGGGGSVSPISSSDLASLDSDLSSSTDAQLASDYQGILGDSGFSSAGGGAAGVGDFVDPALSGVADTSGGGLAGAAGSGAMAGDAGSLGGAAAADAGADTTSVGLLGGAGMGLGAAAALYGLNVLDQKQSQTSPVGQANDAYRAAATNAAMAKAIASGQQQVYGLDPATAAAAIGQSAQGWNAMGNWAMNPANAAAIIGGGTNPYLGGMGAEASPGGYGQGQKIGLLRSQ